MMPIILSCIAEIFSNIPYLEPIFIVITNQRLDLEWVDMNVERMSINACGCARHSLHVSLCTERFQYDMMQWCEHQHG